MGLSIAGVSFSTIPLVNVSYAVAKSLAKYTRNLPALFHNPVFKQFLASALTAHEAEKVWQLFEQSGGSVPTTAAGLSRIIRAEDIDTLLSLIKHERKTGNAFIILTGESGLDLYRATPETLKSHFMGKSLRETPKRLWVSPGLIFSSTRSRSFTSITSSP
jgi:Tat protein secretion system quality control protein TatD with DNase activity